jgi:RNA polymerase sigma-70 factor (ECF subfamily)
MAGLTSRLARGEPAAFAELYDACADRLHHYLVVQLASRDAADDVLQETFVRLARSRERLAGVENLVAYVFAVARNEAARALARGSSDKRFRKVPAAELYDDAASKDREGRENAEAVAMALARLRPEEREIVVLKTSGGLTFREIAEVTGVPQGTVATRYRAAIARLRGWLNEESHD